MTSVPLDLQGLCVQPTGDDAHLVCTYTISNPTHKTCSSCNKGQVWKMWLCIAALASPLLRWWVPLQSSHGSVNTEDVAFCNHAD
jgi:hypothetical protein